MSINTNTNKIVLDWDRYCSVARQAVGEGNVLLKNDCNVLPLKKDSRLAVFGRIQFHYYKSGTGSGGMVNVSKVVSILDALLESKDVIVNEKLMNTYKEWEKEHPFCQGIGWGNEPWSQEEMPLDDKLVEDISSNSDAAVVIIGRTAGEDKDNHNTAGSYHLTEAEEDMLSKVRKAFNKMIVILNVGNIIDMSFIDQYNPDAVLYGWQGGMIGGFGTADVLTGRINPSGKLPDTIAYSIKDYPSDPYFGDPKRNFYAEDIYVGYKYFETAAKEKVRFPFGFGLSYTEFDINVKNFKKQDNAIDIQVSVTNKGKCPGKEVVQIYFEAPQGALGKPLRSLAAFQKTKELSAGETQLLSFTIDITKFASYDDSGVTGNKSCYVLEAGEYKLYCGNNVRDAFDAGSFTLDSIIITEKLTEALAPVIDYKRMKPVFTDKGCYEMGFEAAPLSTIDIEERRKANLPKEIEYKGDKGLKLIDVKEGRASMEDFISELSDEDLSCIIRGEGMGSPKVTPGTAAAFGGVSQNLKALGIPCGCCSDGPSGMRLDCGTKAFSLPNGILLACTFNVELVEELFCLTGIEMVKNKIDCLLGPGMNIHRHPLNGRNFEYFSEDPVLTGLMAAAQLRGMRKAGVTGTIKHFCGNNQEAHRAEIDSVVSERALREIYLKGFEIAVKEGGATSIMTTYGAINGLWTAGNYDLNTEILRNEWGFKGIVMTDWWAKINDKDKEPVTSNFAGMARAQNDLYMVCADGSINSSGDNTLEELKSGKLSRGELQRNAINICSFLMETHAMDRMNGIKAEVEVINSADEEESWNNDDVVYYNIEDTVTIPLNDIDASKGSSYVFALDARKAGVFSLELTAKSDLNELAQIPITIFVQSIASGVFTWNGTNGNWVTQSKKILVLSKYAVIRLYFGQNGVELKELKVNFEKEIKDRRDIEKYLDNNN